MQKYFTTKNIKDAHYEGLKPDQARVLYLIASSAAEGMTDAQLAGFDVDGNPTEDPKAGLKVKTALLRTGLLMAETVPGERKGSERVYQYTGVPVSETLSRGVRRVAGAVVELGTGTKSQFAEVLVRQAKEHDIEMDDDKAMRAINGVWLRLTDLGIITPVKKSEAAATDAPAAATAEDESYDE